jgi:uncharacterized BrkB/YihY/UPF0761 family membrane protein
MKKRIIGIWTLFGIICVIALTISLYFIINSLKEASLNQRLMNVIGVPLICLVICVLLGFGFHSVIENMKKDILIDENDVLKVEEIGQAYKKNGQPIITTLGFFLLCFIVLFVISIYTGVNDSISKPLMVGGIILSLLGTISTSYFMLYLNKQYNQDDYEAGLKYLTSLKDVKDNQED